MNGPTFHIKVIVTYAKQVKTQNSSEHWHALHKTLPCQSPTVIICHFISGCLPRKLLLSQDNCNPGFANDELPTHSSSHMYVPSFQESCLCPKIPFMFPVKFPNNLRLHSGLLKNSRNDKLRPPLPLLNTHFVTVNAVHNHSVAAVACTC